MLVFLQFLSYRIEYVVYWYQEDQMGKGCVIFSRCILIIIVIFYFVFELMFYGSVFVFKVILFFIECRMSKIITGLYILIFRYDFIGFVYSF